MQTRREKKHIFRRLHSGARNYVKLNGKTTAIYRLADEGWREKRGERNKTLINWMSKKKAKRNLEKTFCTTYHNYPRNGKILVFIVCIVGSARSRAPNLIIAAILHSLRKSLTVLLSQTAATWQQTAMAGTEMPLNRLGISWLADENLMNFDGLFSRTSVFFSLLPKTTQPRLIVKTATNHWDKNYDVA